MVGVGVAAAVADRAGAERRIDVDRVERAVAERGDLVERVAADHAIGRAGAPEVDDLAGSRERAEALLRFPPLDMRPHYYGVCGSVRGTRSPTPGIAPRRPRAMLQLRLASGLLDYPRGKSAMVHYEHAADRPGGGDGVGGARTARTGIVCRHLIETDAATDLVAFYAKLSDEFVRRFGASPRFAGSPR